MAYIRKQRNMWRAEIQRNGVRKSATFLTKAEANAWATKEEATILTTQANAFPNVLFAEAVDRYIQEVSIHKKGHRYETLRLNLIKREYGWLMSKVMHKIQPADMVRWRDDRLKKITSGSVLREINLLSHIFTIARKEWGWCGQSPISSIRRPPDNPSRDRRVLPREVKAICRQLGYITGQVETKQQEVALAFLISLRTAMRAGEILSIDDKRADLEHRVITVPHKTQYITGKERTIPITRKAAKLIMYLKNRNQYFTINSATLSSFFRRATKRLFIEDLHFHDARAEALTRLSRRVDVMTLAKISGHKDLKILLNTYYRESAEDIAARI